MYVASADWMTRNLYKRVEVAFPIDDPSLYKELRTIVDIQLADNLKARIINEAQDNPRKMAREADKKHRSQMEIYAYCQNQTLAISSTES